jgi:hypothetical protein
VQTNGNEKPQGIVGWSCTVVTQMIHPTRTLLTATLGLIMSAIVATAEDIPITSLPYTITASGTYVFTQDLTYSDPANPAITIQPAFGVATAIVLDLRGHTLSGYATSSVTIGILNVYRFGGKPITIRNGTIQNYSLLVSVANSHYEANQQVGVVLDHLTFDDSQNPAYPNGTEAVAVHLGQMNNSTVSNCVFQHCNTAIADGNSLGGNRYVNDSFFACETTLQIDLYSPVTGVMKDCVFAPYVPQQ